MLSQREEQTVFVQEQQPYSEYQAKIAGSLLTLQSQKLERERVREKKFEQIQQEM